MSRWAATQLGAWQTPSQRRRARFLARPTARGRCRAVAAPGTRTIADPPVPLSSPTTHRHPPLQGVGAANLAKRLIDAVRRRKGLPVEEKVVESATKQRTRARKV